MEMDELLNDEITYNEVERDVVKLVEVNVVKLVIKLHNGISYVHCKCDVYFFSS